jgi:trans-aconitate methyltransferase
VASGQAWDREYQEGEWDYLRRFDEEVRYEHLAACIASRGDDHRKVVVDLGCGIGLLREHLPTDSIAQYIGIDWSSEAIAQAREQRYEQSDFVAASIDEWEPDNHYDAIVFNEVLYYLPQPVETVARYAHCLADGGSIFVSMWHPAIFISPRHPTRSKILRARHQYRRIWRALDSDYKVTAEIVVKRDRVQRWRIQELRPGRV